MPDIIDKSNQYLVLKIDGNYEKSVVPSGRKLSSKKEGQRLQHSGRAHASGAKTPEVVGSNPAGCWAFFFFFCPFSPYNKLVECPKSGPSKRCISTNYEANKKIVFLAVLLGAKQA